MLLILKRLKRSILSSNQFRKYLLYALGEMVLVIMGILIALQIDNWNTEKKQEASLRSYLSSIAGNISSDLQVVNQIRRAREKSYELSYRERSFIGRKRTFEIAEIAFASYALSEASKLHFFNANPSGYEALKSSGTLGRLQGRDIEGLLHDYYHTVSRIGHQEQSHNENVRLLWLQAVTAMSNELESFEFESPEILMAHRFEALQPVYKRLLNHPSVAALFDLSQATGTLIQDYDSLDRLGSAFIRMVEKGRMEFDDETSMILDSIYVPGQETGHADLIVNGQISWHAYRLLDVDSNRRNVVGTSVDPVDGNREREQGLVFSYNSIEQFEDSLHLIYPGGANWAAFSFITLTHSEPRRGIDYSGFDKLVLELKGDKGGETLLVNIKDVEDPDDGTQTNIELQLTNQWQTYEIDLDQFETADLKTLYVPLAFLFLEEAQSFSVRTARYVNEP